jgi:hypothetical protein
VSTPVLLLPSVGDAWLRAQLPGAVLARPLDDAVPRPVWQLVARSLEVTGHAVACAQEGSDPVTTAALAGAALRQTSCASACLARTGGARQEPAWTPARPPRRVASPVERTWFRLAGLLAGPDPADVRVLAQVLADHEAALAAWRQVLLAPTRLSA